MSDLLHLKTLLLIALTLSVACSAGDDYRDSLNNDFHSNNHNNNPPPPGDGSNNNNNNNFEPEREYNLSQPAVFGETIFIANETLNSVVMINTRSLSINTTPVGARPTRVVGPQRALASEQARIYVLNAGVSYVSIINPSTQASTALVPVLPHSNELVAAPDGRHAVAWFSSASAQAGQAGDLSSVTVLRGERAFQVAVGFHVRRVTFTQDSARALVLTDDGLSVIDLDALDGDQLAIPVPLVPPALRQLNPLGVDVQLTRDGKYAVTRTSIYPGLILLDVANRTHTLVRLSRAPSDIDLVEREGHVEALLMLHTERAALRLSIPEGFVAIEAAQAAIALNGEPLGDMGDDADMADEADMAEDMGVEQDMADEADMEEEKPDMGAAIDLDELDGLDGVSLLRLSEEQLFASVSGDGRKALLYSTLPAARRVELLDLVGGELRGLRLEKSMLGVLPDEAGESFVVFHGREAQGSVAGLTPADPEFIERRWGVSIVNVASAISRLVLTQLEPDGASLWREPSSAPRMYIWFGRPERDSQLTMAHRDVLEVNMTTFSVDSLRVPSLPLSVGAVPGAGRVYISQDHPQGRMTFLDVLTGKRQTVTGYQLNAGID